MVKTLKQHNEWYDNLSFSEKQKVDEEMWDNMRTSTMSAEQKKKYYEEKEEEKKEMADEFKRSVEASKKAYIALSSEKREKVDEIYNQYDYQVESRGIVEVWKEEGKKKEQALRKLFKKKWWKFWIDIPNFEMGKRMYEQEQLKAEREKKIKIMQELLNQIQEKLTAIQEDAAKFNKKGNKAAGTRVSKAMQTIKGLAQDVRVAVSAANNATG